MKHRMKAAGSYKLVLGVDIGGTKVAVGLVNSQGQIQHAVRAPMIARGSAEQGFRAVQNAMESVMLHCPRRASASDWRVRAGMGGKRTRRPARRHESALLAQFSIGAKNRKTLRAADAAHQRCQRGGVGRSKMGRRRWT